MICLFLLLPFGKEILYFLILTIVLIHDIRFKGKRQIDWEDVEEYVKGYVDQCYEMIETVEKIYIGKDFPDEFSHIIISPFTCCGL